MIISESPNGGLNVFKDAVVVSGMSFVFSRSFHRAYSPTPFDPKTELCEEEQAERLVRSTTGGVTTFELTERPEMVGHITRAAIPLNLLHPYNYFHFLIEWLPSLVGRLVEGSLPAKALIVTGKLHVNMWEPLELLIGRWHLPVLQLGLGQSVTCDHVFQLRPSYHAVELIAGGIKPPSYDARNLTLLRAGLKRFWTETDDRRKLFVRRRSRGRHIVNEAEIEALATAAGYEIVDPGASTFRDQVSLFSQASHIVGPTGAWISNLACAPSGAKVAIFLPETATADADGFWKPLGDIFDLDVSEHHCPIPELHERPIHSDFVVPPELARQIFSR